MTSAAEAVVDLVADIGGTNARFALVGDDARPYAEATLPAAGHPGLADAVRAYLAQAPQQSVRSAAFAIATAITGDHVQFTNSGWSFSTEATRRELGLQRLLLLNDFTALAHSLPALSGDELRQVGGGTAVPDTAVGVIGPGTGLGVSGLVPVRGGWVPLQGEGGHCSLSPADAREARILERTWQHFGHVSTERLVSGIGLETLYRAVAEVDGFAPVAPEPARITVGALAGDPACAAVMDVFCSLLGTAAGNLALTIGARGGIYIGGGIVPRLGDFFDRSPFRARFEAKGRFAGYMAAIPTFVILARTPALTGAARALRQS